MYQKSIDLNLCPSRFFAPLHQEKASKGNNTDQKFAVVEDCIKVIMKETGPQMWVELVVMYRTEGASHAVRITQDPTA